MDNLTVGRINFGTASVGAVLERPTGELAALWLLYANSLEREAKLRKKLSRKKREPKGRAFASVQAECRTRGK